METLEEIELAMNQLIERHRSLHQEQHAACATLIQVEISVNDHQHIRNLNNSIEILKEMKITAQQFFNESLKFLHLDLKQEKKHRKSAKTCFEELKSHLSSMKLQLREIERKGEMVKSFDGINNFRRNDSFLEAWIDIFLLQITKHKISWSPQHVESYKKEIEGFNEKIDNVKFLPTNRNLIVEQISANALN